MFILNNWEPGRVPEYRRGRGIDFLVYRPAAAPAPPLRILFHAQSSFDPRIARFRRAGERLEPLLFQESAALDALRKRARGASCLSAKDEGCPSATTRRRLPPLPGSSPAARAGCVGCEHRRGGGGPVGGARGIVVHRFGWRGSLAWAPVRQRIVSPASIEMRARARPGDGAGSRDAVVGAGNAGERGS